MEAINILWEESHPYVMTRGEQRGPVIGEPKALHVSPLMGMDQTYSLRATEPGEKLIVQIDSRPRGGFLSP